MWSLPKVKSSFNLDVSDFFFFLRGNGNNIINQDQVPPRLKHLAESYQQIIVQNH